MQDKKLNNEIKAGIGMKKMMSTGTELTFAEFGWESKKAVRMVARQISSVE